MLSLGDWTYDKNFTAEIFDDNQQSLGNSTLYLEGLKVGDKHKQYYTWISHRFGSKLRVDLDYRFVDGLYADYDIVDDEILKAQQSRCFKITFIRPCGLRGDFLCR